LAIDLYNLAYEGGAKEPHELVDTYKSSCGIYAHNAIKPTQELFALARSLKLPVFYTTTETRKEAKPGAVHATNRQRVKIDPQAFEIKEEFKPESGDVVIFKERASGFFGTPLVAHPVAAASTPAATAETTRPLPANDDTVLPNPARTLNT